MTCFVKAGVRLSGLKQEMLIALDIITDVMDRYGYHCVLTSGRDKGHSNYSHHYKGLAIDVRSKHVTPEQKIIVLHAIRAALGIEHQVILESVGKLNEHFHIEYDPQTIGEDHD